MLKEGNGTFKLSEQLKKQTVSTSLGMLQFNWIGTVGGQKRLIGLVEFNPSVGYVFIW